MIDYAKYENADYSTILRAYNSVEKKRKKLFYKLDESYRLLVFLEQKLTSQPKPKEQFYTLDTSPAIKAIDAWAEQHPKELAEAKAQLAKELGY